MIIITIYGWDQSHYDAPMTSRDGVDFVTHKCAEGHHFYRDLEYKPAMANAKAFGVPVLGAYFVNHSGTVSDQVDWFLQLVNLDTPWWREVPWMFQIDAEKFAYMDRAPNLAEINAFGDLICSRAQVPSGSVIAYAPKWLYGDTLKGLRYKLWASSYVSGSGPYKTLYPGDSSPRWGAYSGQTPIILQYSSSAVIAGQTTCDANAFRGTLEQLITEIGGGTDVNLSDKLSNGKTVEEALVAAYTTMIRSTWMADGVENDWNKIADLTVSKMPEIDVNALAAAIVAALPEMEGISIEQVTAACMAALTKQKLVVEL